MLLLKHNDLSSQDLITIECLMVKIADPKYIVPDLNNFSIIDKSRPELYGYILGFCERLGLCESIGVTPSEFLDFVVDIDKGYLPNAYHSFFHAVDVAIVLYHMICKYDISKYISRFDIAALMIAGLCHDIGHPGKNNNFQVNLKTDLAIRYSNKSVLESYSCTITMDLLTEHKLLQRLESASISLGYPTTESEMRTSIIKMILATDMIFHYELQENLANLLEIIIESNEQQLIHKIESQVNKDSSTPCSCTYHQHPHQDQPNQPLETHESDFQLKDIFSAQGAKSAISYFRRKSYFEQDIIPHQLKQTHHSQPVLRSKSEPYIKKEKQHHHQNKLESTVTEPSHTSGIDLIKHSPSEFIIEPQQRLILCQIVLHAADISNALRPWPICLSWSNLVCEEFFCQGDAEKQQGLKISPNMDRNQVSQTTIGLQFGDFVVSPYFEIFAALFPKADELVKTLAENRTQWIKMEEELQEKEAIQNNHLNERLPLNILPDRPILNPSGRRVSVAAGMVVIPEDLEEKTIGSGKNKRKYWSVRSVSHSDISNLSNENHEVIKRRKSEEPNNIKSRRIKVSTLSPNKNNRENQQLTLPIINQ